MLAKRYLIVSVFAGGCLSGALVIGVWHETVVTVPHEASNARTVERYREPTAADPDDDPEVADTPNVAGDAPPKTAEAHTETPAEGGSSVAELLHALEVAYRQSLAATPEPAQNPQAPARDVPARDETQVAAAAPVTQKTNAPSAAAPAAPSPARAPEPAAADARQLLASRDDARPRDVHIGEINQVTNVRNEHDGDVYVIEHVFPYPYLAFPRHGFVAPGYAPRPVQPRPGVPAAPPQKSFTYPDSVFKYPVELVH